MDQQLMIGWIQALASLAQIGLIAWGLWRMGIASEERNRQLDIMEARAERQGEVLGQQSEVLAELLRRSA